MSNIWFCSDHHFGHKNILEFEKEHRRFANLDEMHEEIIYKHNNLVRPNDIVYFLGDFAFSKKNISIAAKLHGKKRLVLGNHDTYSIEEYAKYFEKILGLKYWENCVLSHAPLHLYNLKKHHESYGIEAPLFLNVHGHLHSRNVMIPLWDDKKLFGSITDKFYFNVSIEQNHLMPTHADVIRERAKKLI